MLRGVFEPSLREKEELMDITHPEQSVDLHHRAVILSKFGVKIPSLGIKQLRKVACLVISVCERRVYDHGLTGNERNLLRAWDVV